MLRMLISVPIIAAILIFAFVNNELVTFNLWTDVEITASFSVVVVSFILLGFILGKVSSWFAYLPLRKDLLFCRMENKKLNKEQEKTHKEVEVLKNKEKEVKSSEPSTFAKLFKSPEDKQS